MSSLKYFISYTQTDHQWAEWIAWQVCEHGHEVVLAAWDFGPGSNRVNETHRALASTDATIAILSPEYLASAACTAEWASTFTDDPAGEARKLIPVRVRTCRPDGLLAQRVGVDLVSVAGEQAAVEALGRIFRETGAPSTKPRFPGAGGPAFPGGDIEVSEKPEYVSEETRTASDRLSAAYETLEDQENRELDTTAIRQQILDLRRELREGGLKAGDFLDDGRYRLIRTIGKGGFAQVWKAYDRVFRRHVAVKVLHPQYSEDRTRRERFARGASRMAELQHQGIVQVLEPVREDGGHHFFVMEFVPGGDFQKAVREGRLTLEERLQVILRVGEALTHAHARGIVHRDVKPANILLDASGWPKLTDFDLVRASDTTGGTRTGMMGTFLYAAPEMLLRPQDADVRADVYGLGMTAIFAVHGADLPLDVLRNAAVFVGGLECSPHLKRALRQGVSWDAASRSETIEAFCAGLRSAMEPAVPQIAKPPAGAKVRSGGIYNLSPPVPLPPDDGWTQRQKLGALLMVFAVAVWGFGSWYASLETVDVSPRPASEAFTVPPPADASVGEQEAVVNAPPPTLMAATRFRPAMKRLEGGPFWMGSPEDEPDRDNDEARHRVEISGFWVAQTEVTQGQYEAVIGKNPVEIEKDFWGNACASSGVGSSLPVICVGWTDALRFCNALSKEEGLTPVYEHLDSDSPTWNRQANGYRLLTEAEWEYAARAGTSTRFVGTDQEAGVCEYGNVADASAKKKFPDWPTFACDDGYATLAPVEAHRSNGWELVGFVGNAWEWVWDGYEASFPDTLKNPVVDRGSYRVLRGGSWWIVPRDTRVAFRYRIDPSRRSHVVGFRVARSLLSGF